MVPHESTGVTPVHYVISLLVNGHARGYVVSGWHVSSGFLWSTYWAFGFPGFKNGWVGSLSRSG